MKEGPDHMGGGITGGVVCLMKFDYARDEYGRERAVKLADPNHYSNRSYTEELLYASKLSMHGDLFPVLYEASPVEVSLGDGERKKCIAFVEDLNVLVWLNLN